MPFCYSDHDYAPVTLHFCCTFDGVKQGGKLAMVGHRNFYIFSPSVHVPFWYASILKEFRRRIHVHVFLHFSAQGGSDNTRRPAIRATTLAEQHWQLATRIHPRPRWVKFRAIHRSAFYLVKHTSTCNVIHETHITNLILCMPPMPFFGDKPFSDVSPARVRISTPSPILF
jgi:hypothetical protein